MYDDRPSAQLRAIDANGESSVLLRGPKHSRYIEAPARMQSALAATRQITQPIDPVESLCYRLFMAVNEYYNGHPSKAMREIIVETLKKLYSVFHDHAENKRSILEQALAAFIDSSASFDDQVEVIIREANEYLRTTPRS